MASRKDLGKSQRGRKRVFGWVKVWESRERKFPNGGGPTVGSGGREIKGGWRGVETESENRVRRGRGHRSPSIWRRLRV